MKSFFIGLLVVSMATLFGCGGGGSTQETVATVSGTASQGKALATGTVVTLTDAKGATKTATVGANGAYNVVVDGLTAPYVLNAGGFYSYASASGTTNINPLTNLSMQLAFGGSAVSTTLPANFATQFAAVVSNLKSAFSGLYPASIAATQTDFINGTIVIGSGVDKVFDFLTLTTPNASGNFTASLNGQQIVSGTASTITPVAAAIAAASSTLFPTTPTTTGFTAAMLSGKSMVMNSSNSAHVYTYNADGTWTAKYTDGSTTATSAGTWSIDASGHLIWTKTYDPLDNGASSTVNKPQTMTLVSSTSTTLTVSASGTTGVWTYVSTPTTPTATGFTTAMLSGKTFTYVDSNSNTGTIAFNTNGTSTGIAGTWSINASGQLVIYVTSSKNTATFTLTSSTSTKITASESVSNGSQATITFTAA